MNNIDHVLSIYSLNPLLIFTIQIYMNKYQNWQLTISMK